jgi:hypothetical protein
MFALVRFRRDVGLARWLAAYPSPLPRHEGLPHRASRLACRGKLSRDVAISRDADNGGMRYRRCAGVLLVLAYRDNGRTREGYIAISR